MLWCANVWVLQRGGVFSGEQWSEEESGLAGEQQPVTSGSATEAPGPGGESVPPRWGHDTNGNSANGGYTPHPPKVRGETGGDFSQSHFKFHNQQNKAHVIFLKCSSSEQFTS